MCRLWWPLTLTYIFKVIRPCLTWDRTWLNSVGNHEAAGVSSERRRSSFNLLPVSIIWGNGLLPTGDKPLLESVLTKLYEKLAPNEHMISLHYGRHHIVRNHFCIIRSDEVSGQAGSYRLVVSTASRDGFHVCLCKCACNSVQLQGSDCQGFGHQITVVLMHVTDARIQYLYSES